MTRKGYKIKVTSRPPRSTDGKRRINKTMGFDPYWWIAFTEHVERQKQLLPSLSNGNCVEATFNQVHPEIARRAQQIEKEEKHEKRYIDGIKDTGNPTRSRKAVPSIPTGEEFDNA